jgi:hypothetical protein
MPLELTWFPVHYEHGLIDVLDFVYEINDQWLGEVSRQHITPVLHMFRIQMIAKALGICVRRVVPSENPGLYGL